MPSLDEVKEKLRQGWAQATNSTTPKFSGRGRALGAQSQQAGQRLGTGGNAPHNGPRPAQRSSPPRAPTRKAATQSARPLGITDQPAPAQQDNGRSCAQPSAPIAHPGEAGAGPSSGASDSEPQITDDMHLAAATLLSTDGLGPEAAQTICKLLFNILRHPRDLKFRQLKTSNARIAATLAAPGAEDILCAVGFEYQQGREVLQLADPSAHALSLAHGACLLLTPDSALSDAAVNSSAPAEASNGTPVHLDVPTQSSQEPTAQSLEASDSTPVQQVPGDRKDAVFAAPQQSAGSEGVVARHAQLGVPPDQWRAQTGARKAVDVGGVAVVAAQPAATRHAAASACAADSRAAPPSPPAPFTGRNTKVLLPVAAGADVSDVVFKRTPAEVQRDFRRARERREQQETLMTRAMREKLAPKSKKAHTFACIRVRFREGLVLQGDFEPSEPVVNIFAWVEDHLRINMPFALASPALATKSRQLARDGTVQTQGLMPSFLLNFSWHDRSMAPPDGLCLSEAALDLIQADTN